jgi:hypothetical protein
MIKFARDRMNVELEKLEKFGDGWNICLRVNEKNINPDSIKKIEEWQVTLKEDQLYFEGFMDLSEPWEDEPLEELVKAAKLEVEWNLKKLSM